MNKVILTKEQAEAFDFLKGYYFNDENYNSLIEKKCEGYTHPNVKALNEVNHIDFVRALDNGYEIEQPKFEVGDWAIRINDLDSYNAYFKGEKPFKITEVKELCVIDDKACGHNFRNIRHATKEEAFWAELGRDVGEFRKGDILPSMFSKSNLYKLNSLQDVLDAKMDYRAGRLRGYYPAESFVSFTQ